MIRKGLLGHLRPGRSGLFADERGQRPWGDDVRMPSTINVRGVGLSRSGDLTRGHPPELFPNGRLESG